MDIAETTCSGWMVFAEATNRWPRPAELAEACSRGAGQQNWQKLKTLASRD